MQLFLGIIASILFCLVVYIVFFNTGVQETIISNKNKKKIFDIIDSDNTVENKVDILINIIQQNGKKNYIRLYNYLNKNRYNKKLTSTRIKNIDNILLYLDSTLCRNAHLTYLIVKIEKSLNDRDYDDLKKQVGELKDSLVNQRYENGYDKLYAKISSIVLAIITVISFIMAFGG